MQKFLVISILLILVGSASGAEKAWHNPPDSAQELINPLTRSLRLAFTLNFDSDIGPEDKGEELTLLNTRLVFPFRLSRDWFVISRTVFRYFNLKDVPVAGEDTEGLSDTVVSLFVSPVKLGEKGLLWGIGPVLLLPTATDELLGTEKWGLGPTAGVVRQAGPWTVQMIARHTWSVAGNDRRSDFSLTGFEPVLAYTIGRNWNILADSNAAYDWKSDNWLVPLNIGVSRRLQIGRLPVLVSGGGRYWIESPDSGPEGFGFRFSVVLQFPKGN